MKTVRELSELLACSYESARVLVSSGQIEAINLSAGKRPNYRITPEAIDRFIQSRATSTATAKTKKRKAPRKAKREWV